MRKFLWVAVVAVMAIAFSAFGMKSDTPITYYYFKGGVPHSFELNEPPCPEGNLNHCQYQPPGETTSYGLYSAPVQIDANRVMWQ